jgi:chorismate synthase
MASNSFGDNFRVTTFGESHGPALGVVIDGVRPGLAVDVEAIQHELDRRRPGTSPLSSPRKEADRLEVLSGLHEGRTTGAPIAILFRNHDTRSQDYEAIRDLFRPGHADLTWWRKFGIRDWRGGGRTSGRETVARVAAGALARQVLAAQGVSIVGHVVRIGEVVAETYDPSQIERNDVRCADARAAERMFQAVQEARKEGDSLGGVVEVVATGVPAGWGDPVFQKLDAQLGAALLSIGAVKGVEIGDGFALASRRGSGSNDEILPEGFASNHMGGILGGISSGAPIVVRAAVKPTSSIRRPQRTIDTAGRPQTIRVPGRHDPCICPRVVPVAEAMVALVLCDAFLRQQAIVEAACGEAELEAELAYCDAEILRLVRRRRDVWQAAGGRLAGAAEAELDRLRDDLARRLGLSGAAGRELGSILRRETQRPAIEAAVSLQDASWRSRATPQAPVYGPVLLGMRGAGKSTVAPLVAAVLGMDVLDTDVELERRAGRSIPEIFRVHGEEGFRRLEREVVLEALGRPELVVATGGGAVLAAEVREVLARRYTVWLQAPLQVLAERIAGSDRPSLTGSDIRQELEALYAEREPLYRSVATLDVETTGLAPIDLAREVAAGWIAETFPDRDQT